jgi:phospholipid N-methyltransferase
VAKAKNVVELGPGDGSTTQQLLAAMPADSRLLAIELVPELADVLRSLNDQRITVEHGDACLLEHYLKKHDMPEVDVVVSGIPFSNLDRDQAMQIVHAIYQALVPGGTFIAYQFRDQINGLALERFGEPEVTFVPWNLPPLHLYHWTRPLSPNGRTGTS